MYSSLASFPCLVSRPCSLSTLEPRGWNILGPGRPARLPRHTSSICCSGDLSARCGTTVSRTRPARRSKNKPSVGTVFYCFLRNGSWNLILLIPSSCLPFPTLNLDVLADKSALARCHSACKTTPLLSKDLSLQLSCDYLQTSRRKLP